MWIYEQRSGKISNGTHSFTGYAGHAPGLNDPEYQNVRATGPLPRGLYSIHQPTFGGHTGAFSMPLAPDPKNNMFGRSAFFIHGDNPRLDHTASDGCIVLSRDARQAIWNSGDHLLTVVLGD